jgi:hypothetical protein
MISDGRLQTFAAGATLQDREKGVTCPSGYGRAIPTKRHDLLQFQLAEEDETK